jgi:hypothetical protein
LLYLANANDNMLVEEDQYMQIEDLEGRCQGVYSWQSLAEPDNEQDIPDFKKGGRPRLIKYFGANQLISKQIISLQNDRGTSYDLYVQIQDQLASSIQRSYVMR